MQAMPLARAITLVYAFLIIYASLNPFDFDMRNGVRGIAWIAAPMPRFIPAFDVVTNVLVYIPLGFLLVFALYPRYRQLPALLIALAMGAILAGVVETLQTWLPTRIPSETDWWSNALGSLIGALLAIPLGPQWLSGSALRRQFDEWFGLNWGASALFLLFPWAQIYPQSAWLGMGAWRQFVGPENWGTLVMNQTVREGLITTACWFGVGMLLSIGMRSKAPQWRLLTALLFITILIKTGFTSLQFGSEFGSSWLTAGATWGMVFGSLILLWGLRWPLACRFWAGLISLLLMALLVNLFPDNPYFTLTLKAWYQGRLLHFNDLMQWISYAWLPFAMVWAIQHQLKPTLLKRPI